MRARNDLKSASMSTDKERPQAMLANPGPLAIGAVGHWGCWPSELLAVGTFGCWGC